MKNSEDFSNSPFYSTPEDNMRMKALLFWKRKANLKTILRVVGVLFVIVLTISAGVFMWKRSFSVVDVAKQIPENAENVFVNDVSGVTPAIEKPLTDPATDVFVSKSDRYQIKQISFGGGAELLSGETETMPFEIANVRSEVLSSRDGSQSSVLIHWNTSKMASSDVVYDKGGVSKKLSEGGFGYYHAVVISELEKAQRYTFVIFASDRWGNQKQSENFSVYTGKETASIFDMIATQFKDIFSWTRMGN